VRPPAVLRTLAAYAEPVTLFDPPAETAREAANAPLAARMRPRTLDEVVGQEHLRSAGSPLRRLVEGEEPMSLILFGPPGSGKTTLALIVSNATNRHFVQLSALSAGVKDVRAVIDDARRELTYSGRQTVLFIDEIHRFSKTQQDSLLGAVETRTITLVAATTENPFFSIVSPLLSRSLLLTLQPLRDEDVNELVDRALYDQRGLGGAVTLEQDARAHLIRMAAGDARRALNALEAAAGTSETIDLATLEKAIDTAAVRYDRDGDQHYDVISAFIKSIRGSDVDAALHYLARMIEAGEDPRFIARRLVIHASEDIGMADPSALLAAMAAAQAVQLIGLPEARINLAQATIHLATAPKSNAVVRAIDEAPSPPPPGRCAGRQGRRDPTPPARRPLRGRHAPRPCAALRLPTGHCRGRCLPAVPAGRTGRPRLLPPGQSRRRACRGRAAGPAARGNPGN
jgi:putative ATPase